MTTVNEGRADETQYRIKPTKGTIRDHGDSGGASRFFYTAKATREEREAGCESMDQHEKRWGGSIQDGRPHTKDGYEYKAKARNDHPTCKPINLMRWLCRLVTPPHGIILDPFSGSGTTGCAARMEGFRFVGFEQDDHYCEIANARIAATRERLGDVKPSEAKQGQQIGLLTEEKDGK